MNNKPAIVFDLGNVIINLKDESVWWEEDVFPYFDALTIEQLMNRGFFQEYEVGNITDEEFRLEIHMARKYDSGLNVVDNAWNALLLDIPPQRVALLEALSKNHDLYLLSNTNNIHLSYVRQLSKEFFGYDLFERFFQKCYFSHELHCCKPGEEIYRKLWNDESLSPKNSIYLDDKKENLQFPAQIGVTCLQVNPSIGFQDQLLRQLNKL